MNGGRGEEGCAKRRETPIFNQITKNLTALERKTAHKKCKLLKKGLQIFLPIFRRVEWVSEWYHRQLAGMFERRSNAVQTICRNAEKLRDNALKRSIKTLKQ